MKVGVIKMQVLLYDDQEMRIYNVVEFYKWNNDFAINEVQETTYKVRILSETSKAELDPTTMKRIAKYNLDKEFWEINDKINKAHEELLRLDKEVNERSEKILLMDDLIEMIWEDEDFDEDKYLPDDGED